MSDTIVLSTKYQIQRLITSLLQYSPNSNAPVFLHEILFRLNYVISNDKTLTSTLAVDNFSSIYINADYFLSLNQLEQYAVLLHESMHIAMFHFDRSVGKLHKEWNEACDLIINNLLIKNHYQLPENVLHGFVANNESEEDVYKRLIKNKDKATGNNTGDSDFIIENHNHWHDENSSGEYKLPTKEMVKQVATSFKGDNPSYQTSKNFDAKIYESVFKQDKIDWQELTTDFLKSSQINIKDNYNRESSITRLLRPQLGDKTPYLPKKYNKAIGKIVIVVDTSSSINYFLKEFSNSIKNILLTLELTALIIDCNDKVRNTFELSHDTCLTEKLKFSTGGGTDFTPPFQYIEDNDIELDGLIYLTDGLSSCNYPTPDYPVLWITTQAENFVDFGQIIKINQHN